MNKVVHHTRQNVFEYYVNGRIATPEEKDNLEFEYVSLTHNQGKNNDGLYGEYIRI